MGQDEYEPHLWTQPAGNTSGRSGALRTLGDDDLLGALRSTGFVAPLCVEGAINGQLFQAWVEQQLVKVLRPGDVVVMDNLSSHKGAGVIAAMEAVGATLRYLPAYSPDLNPIELAFSKFKKLLRDGAQRTTDKLWQLCGQVLDLFTESECRNYFKHCGYRYT